MAELLNPAELMKDAAEAVKDDFSIGKELRTAIKASIRQKAVRGIVKEVMEPDHGTA